MGLKKAFALGEADFSGIGTTDSGNPLFMGIWDNPVSENAAE